MDKDATAGAGSVEIAATTRGVMITTSAAMCTVSSITSARWHSALLVTVTATNAN